MIDELQGCELEFGMYPWPALHSCREARFVLKHLFIPPTPATSGLPSLVELKQWTIVANERDVYLLSRVPWVNQIRHIQVTSATVDYLQGPFDDRDSACEILIREFSSLEDLLAFPDPDSALAINHPLLHVWKWNWFHFLNLFWIDATPTFCVRVGVSTLAEEHWLTVKNFSQKVYKGLVHVGEPGNINRYNTAHNWRPALMAPVQVESDYWLLEAIDE